MAGIRRAFRAVVVDARIEGNGQIVAYVIMVRDEKRHTGWRGFENLEIGRLVDDIDCASHRPTAYDRIYGLMARLRRERRRHG